MRQTLKLHPSSRCKAVTDIEVAIARSRPDVLALHYFVTGKVIDLNMPPVTSPARADELWRHTCFEAFIRSSSGAAYYEFNFAPSTQWAAYRLSSYRSEMSVANEISAPLIEVTSDAACYELKVPLALDQLKSLTGDAHWELGLSAVIKEKNGNKSYWALAHPPGEPDFHHSDCFAYQIPAASR